jgi:hypothetical protein
LLSDVHAFLTDNERNHKILVSECAKNQSKSTYDNVKLIYPGRRILLFFSEPEILLLIEPRAAVVHILSVIQCTEKK